VGQQVTLAGWVNRRRDQGGLIFIDLRDRWGIVQVVIDESSNPDAHRIADDARSEYVLQVKGAVRARPEGRPIPTWKLARLRSWRMRSGCSARPKRRPSTSTAMRLSTRRCRSLSLPRFAAAYAAQYHHAPPGVKFIRDYLDERGFVEIRGAFCSDNARRHAISWC
jgi:aspartyl-tRNA synthetase